MKERKYIIMKIHNNNTMKYLEKCYGDEYFEIFGELIMLGFPIQEAINLCYYYLYVIKN